MTKALVWLRRDLRLVDNHALSRATNECDKVELVFVFDTNILDPLPRDDHRVHFLHKVLDSMKDEVNILYGDPVKRIPEFAKKHKVDKVFVNRDYEKYGMKRDEKVKDALFDASINFESFKDQVIFERDELLNNQGAPYKVFTPYKNRFLEKLKNEHIEEHRKKNNINQAHTNEAKSLEKIGFKESDKKLPPINADRKLREFLKEDIADYSDLRNFPALDKTSGLSVYLRFGLISIRSLFRAARQKRSKGSDVWTEELIWRDFYSMILQAFPRVETREFKEDYQDFKWDTDRKLWNAWKEGRTGFPIVDAGMRQLNTEGFMHNRVRMIVASHLTKTLLLDYKKGEAYFAQKLFDFELASNNGGWQWSSSTGCDASPYFRIFNPYSQSEKFDKDCEYILKYVPELSPLPKKLIHHPYKIKEKDEKEYGFELGKDYPHAVVDYSKKRKEILARFKKFNEKS